MLRLRRNKPDRLPPNFFLEVPDFMLDFLKDTRQNCGMRFRFATMTWVWIVMLSLVPASAGTPKSAILVDLNSATIAELLKLPGMTETWARRIVRFRPYRSKLDLQNEGVVPPNVYERIREAVVAHRTATGGGEAGKSR